MHDNQLWVEKNLAVTCPVYTTREEFANGALVLRLGLPSTINRHENAPGGILKTLASGFHFENGAFRKRWRHDNHVISLTEFPTGDCCVFKLLQRSVDGKCLMRFQRETSIFKFLFTFDT